MARLWLSLLALAALGFLIFGMVLDPVFGGIVIVVLLTALSVVYAS